MTFITSLEMDTAMFGSVGARLLAEFGQGADGPVLSSIPFSQLSS